MSADAALTALAALAAAPWMSGSSLPEPRTEVAAATLGGRIVVAGGFLASGANSRRVDAYDPRGDAWERLPDLPVSVDHAAAAEAAAGDGSTNATLTRLLIVNSVAVAFAAAVALVILLVAWLG